ncbi:hypothetical protein ACFVFS_03050 [Kitasatospora sp. NPDC057692]|uniref:hypothetical protein n=1 Tax=Kitasatospora sp. NPDC057692 TaxID=3346215 RepID=UPI0036CE75DD
MGAKHATRGPEPVRRTVGGGRRAARRWPSLPRAVAAGGALLAQLWGFGAPVACAAGAEPLPEPVGRTVGRALTGAAASGDPAERTGPAPSDGLLDGLAGAVPGVATGVLGPELDAVTGSIGRALQERIRAGGLPLPGQRAAVPDAFAIASGLLGTVPAQVRPAEASASRREVSDGPSGADARTAGAARPHRPGGAPHGPAAPPPASAPPDRLPPPAAGRPAPAGGASGRTDGRDLAAVAAGVPAAGASARLLTGTATRTAAVTVAHDTAGTATAVLAPITAGLLLTGAAMYKHRGLPKGH